MRRNSAGICKYTSIHYTENSKKLFSLLNKVRIREGVLNVNRRCKRAKKSFLRVKRIKSKTYRRGCTKSRRSSGPPNDPPSCGRWGPQQVVQPVPADGGQCRGQRPFGEHHKPGHYLETKCQASTLVSQAPLGPPQCAAAATGVAPESEVESLPSQAEASHVPVIPGINPRPRPSIRHRGSWLLSTPL